MNEPYQHMTVSQAVAAYATQYPTAHAPAVAHALGASLASVRPHLAAFRALKAAAPVRPYQEPSALERLQTEEEEILASLGTLTEQIKTLKARLPKIKKAIRALSNIKTG